MFSSVVYTRDVFSIADVVCRTDKLVVSDQLVESTCPPVDIFRKYAGLVGEHWKNEKLKKISWFQCILINTPLR